MKLAAEKEPEISSNQERFVEQATFINLSRVAVQSLRRGPEPTFIILTEHGQTVAYDERVAHAMAEVLVKSIPARVALVVQLNRLVSNNAFTETDGDEETPDADLAAGPNDQLEGDDGIEVVEEALPS